MHAVPHTHTRHSNSHLPGIISRVLQNAWLQRDPHIELKDAQGRANGQKITGLDFLSGVTATTNFIISACKRDFIHAGMPDTETE